MFLLLNYLSMSISNNNIVNVYDRGAMLKLALVVLVFSQGLLAQDTEDLPESERPLVRCRRPMCMMYCPLGFQTDNTGCPVCHCLEDPCQQQASISSALIFWEPRPL